LLEESILKFLSIIAIYKQKEYIKIIYNLKPKLIKIFF